MREIVNRKMQKNKSFFELKVNIADKISKLDPLKQSN